MRLRVGLPPELAALAPTSGHGRTWASVLPQLAQRVDLVVGPRWRRPEVWLLDGHADLPDLRGRPFAVQVHEASWHDPELRALASEELLVPLERRVRAAVERASAVIVPSSSAREQLVAAYGLPPDRVFAALHGVDLERFRPAPGPPAGPPYVLFVGVIHPRKGLRVLREAMAALDVPLVVVGSPPSDRADPRALVAELTAPLPGGLRWERGVSEERLAELMAGAAAFCLPSLWEGFGLPAVEALACGAPVIVSDRGALPEVVGDAGLVVAPEAPAVEAALRRVLADPGDLRERARARAETFTWGRAADVWAAALRSAVGSPAA